MLKACKHRERVNFRLGFSETPLLPGVKRKPVRSHTKRNPSSRAIRGNVWDGGHPPRRHCRAPDLDPVRGTTIEDSIEDLANRILARLDVVNPCLCDAPASSNCCVNH